MKYIIVTGRGYNNKIAIMVDKIEAIAEKGSESPGTSIFCVGASEAESYTVKETFAEVLSLIDKALS